MTYFCDSFALIAWINIRDAAHQPVVEFFSQTKAHILMTDWIILETLDALSKPKFRLIAANLIQALRTDPQFEVIPYDRTNFEAGLELFTARLDKAWSLTDCISFAVMTQRGLTHALTADRHFEQAGFHALFATT